MRARVCFQHLDSMEVSSYVGVSFVYILTLLKLTQLGSTLGSNDVVRLHLFASTEQMYTQLKQDIGVE